jgi:hypothetical protein
MGELMLKWSWRKYGECVWCSYEHVNETSRSSKGGQFLEQFLKKEPVPWTLFVNLFATEVPYTALLASTSLFVRTTITSYAYDDHQLGVTYMSARLHSLRERIHFFCRTAHTQQKQINLNHHMSSLKVNQNRPVQTLLPNASLYPRQFRPLSLRWDVPWFVSSSQSHVHLRRMYPLLDCETSNSIVGRQISDIFISTDTSNVVA